MSFFVKKKLSVWKFRNSVYLCRHIYWLKEKIYIKLNIYYQRNLTMYIDFCPFGSFILRDNCVYVLVKSVWIEKKHFVLCSPHSDFRDLFSLGDILLPAGSIVELLDKRKYKKKK